MNSETEQALRKAAERQGAIDPDIIKLALFEDLTEGIESPDKAAEVVKAMAERKPLFFRERWDYRKMTPDQQAQTEQRLRATQRPGVPANMFKSLDAGRLTESELNALTRYTGGQRNSLDKSTLQRALARQQLEDGALTT
jgi:hypothetical protein